MFEKHFALGNIYNFGQYLPKIFDIYLIPQLWHVATVPEQ